MELISISDAALLFDVTPRTVRRFLRAKNILRQSISIKPVRFHANDYPKLLKVDLYRLDLVSAIKNGKRSSTDINTQTTVVC